MLPISAVSLYSNSVQQIYICVLIFFVTFLKVADKQPLGLQL